MKSHLKLRNAALVSALAAVAATAWATTEYTSYADPGPAPTQASAMASDEAVAVPAEPILASESVSANERVIASEESVAAPVAERSFAQPPITVEDRRLTLDERIQADVMDRLARSENLSGKIGVESRDAVVTLTGYTVTAGQAHRAGRYAGSVEGVKYVQNEIRARIGGSV